ncbi:MAG: hypothetical protein ACRCR9_05165 [Chitinophagaceae bacterium]
MDYTINDNNQLKERQQINDSNKKAFFISCFLCLLLFLSFLFIKRKEPPLVEIAGEQEMEVNIGNIENAWGNDQSLTPNTSSSQEVNEEHITEASTPIEEHNLATDDNSDVKTSSFSPKKLNKQVVEPKSTNPTPPQVINQEQNSSLPEKAPPLPKPKAVMSALVKENINKEENQSDSYNKRGNQGTTQGNGDMGMLLGSEGGITAPVSFSIVKGLSNRNIVYVPQYSDDFNKEGTVRVRVSFNNTGNAIGASFYMPGSNTTDKILINLALKRAKSIKLNQDPSAPIEQEAIFEFLFKIK